LKTHFSRSGDFSSKNLFFLVDQHSQETLFFTKIFETGAKYF
jgi:hypothetical protein